MSPTARALAQLRKDGWLPEVVEKFIPGAGVRRDAWGFADILAISPTAVGVFAVQVTTTAHLADRFKKLTTPPVSDKVRVWLEAGMVVECWGYAKQGPRGGRKTWQLTRRPVTRRDLEVAE